MKYYLRMSHHFYMTIGNEHIDESHIFLWDKGTSLSLVSSHPPNFQQSPVSYCHPVTVGLCCFQFRLKYVARLPLCLPRDAHTLVNVANIIPWNKCSATFFWRKRLTFLGRDSFSWLCMSPCHSSCRCLMEAAPSTFPATCEMTPIPKCPQEVHMPSLRRSLLTPTSSDLLERSSDDKDCLCTGFHSMQMYVQQLSSKMSCTI